MPLTHFLFVLLLVILAAGITLLLAFWAGLPLMALGFATVVASLLLLVGEREWH